MKDLAGLNPTFGAFGGLLCNISYEISDVNHVEIGTTGRAAVMQLNQVPGFSNNRKEGALEFGTRLKGFRGFAFFVLIPMSIVTHLRFLP